jgi:macrolide transport system ATP-binding/permease protein
MTILRLWHVGRTYVGPPEVSALRDVTLTINAGEFVAIVGPSGSGKSTLLNIIGLLDCPTAGTYWVNDLDSAKLSETELASLRRDVFGFVFQSFHLQEHLTAAENVELGLLYHGVPRAERRASAVAALDTVGLSERAEHPARLLSGGERQRVAIARAIVGDASVIVADEPTGSLDTATSQRVVELLRSLTGKGRTVLMVSHDAEVAAAADRQISMRDGLIVSHVDSFENGPPPDDSADATPGRQSMKRRDVLREAGRAIISSPSRAAVLVASLALPVALVVSLLGLTQTSSAQVTERFDARRNREVVATDTIVLDGKATTADDAVDLENRARGVAGVSGAAAIIGGYSQPVSTGPLRPALSLEVVGATSSLFDVVGSVVHRPEGQRSSLGAREAIVGDLAAAELHLGSVAELPTVFVNGQSFTVTGVLKSVSRQTSLRSSLIVAVDDLLVAADVGPTVVLVGTRSGAAQQVASQLAVALDPRNPERFAIEAPRDPRGLREEVESDVRNTMLVLSILAFLVAAMMTATAMTGSVRERYGEFGLRRAIGARSSDVLRQVASEAMILGLIGGVAGLVIGLVGVFVVTIMQQWEPTVDFRAIPVALVSAIVASGAGGVAVAVRAGRIEPQEALRR